jgi:voltage-gated potassium channel
MGAIVLVAVIVLSTLVYYGIGLYHQREQWTLLNCLFMTVITLSTIGYGDWLDIKGLPLATIFTMFLAVVGVAVPAFLITNSTALIVDGLFADVFRRRRMDRDIAALSGHIIVCGVGSTGLHCVEELREMGAPFVAIDKDAGRLRQAFQQLGGFLYVVGRADDDAVLHEAGVLRASGLIAALTDDKDNVFVTLSARALNPKLRIVSKGVEDLARTKLAAAGADAVVNTTAIGGRRLVGEMLSPTVMTFIDTMLREPDDPYRFEEMVVESGSEVDGRTLAEADVRRYGRLLVVAARSPGDEEVVFNPPGTHRLAAGETVVVLGRAQDLEGARRHFRGGLRADGGRL